MQDHFKNPLPDLEKDFVAAKAGVIALEDNIGKEFKRLEEVEREREERREALAEKAVAYFESVSRL